jgi:FixJ family two-component response regulator
VIEAMKMGAFDFVRKEQLPFNLKVVVDSALKANAELQSASAFKPQLTVEQHQEDIVGRSEAMQQVFMMIGRVAGSDAPATAADATVAAAAACCRRHMRRLTPAGRAALPAIGTEMRSGS